MSSLNLLNATAVFLSRIRELGKEGWDGHEDGTLGWGTVGHAFSWSLGELFSPGHLSVTCWPEMDRATWELDAAL